MALDKNNNIFPLPESEWPSDTFGKRIPLKSLVQWRTATVVTAQTGEDNPQPIVKEGDLGAIWVQEHVTSRGVAKETYAKYDDRNRCVPLIRGMGEVPCPGEQVLVAQFGGINYYLGPLNTNNSVNFNEDHLRHANKITSGIEMGNPSDAGYNSSIINRKVRKLSKRLNFKLDNPLYKPITEETINSGGGGDPETGEEKEPFLMPEDLNIHGDMIFEGRFGNSIRIGSRNINPYIMISNGRSYSNATEGSLDGTIIGIFNNGSIREHFQNDNIRIEKRDEENEEVIDQQIKPYPFTLADTEINFDENGVGQPKRSITQTLTTSVGRGLGPTHSEYNETYQRTEPGGKKNEKGIPDPDINNTIYNYNDNQLFVSSDRITLNARKATVMGEGENSKTIGDGSIYLSANQFLNVGAGNNINFSTSNTFLVEAATSMIVNTPMFKVNAPGQVFIDGRQNKDEDGNIVGSIFLGNPGLGDKMAPAVLGDALCSFLCMLISELQTICYCVSEAVENSAATGASYQIMSQRAEALDDLMGIVAKKLNDGSTVAFPEKMANWILSDSVMVKK